MILDILRHNATSLPYAALTALKTLTPDANILQTQASEFNWQNYAHAGLCSISANADQLLESRYDWSQTHDRTTRDHVNGLFTVNWQGETIQLLAIQYESGSCGMQKIVFIISRSIALAEEFFSAVCRWSSMVRDEVLIFQEGYWHKSTELFKSIQQTKLETLILPPGLKETIADDASQFFTARERYERFNIPWKRGLMLLGPPGNGKTHMIQGLINHLEKPCLYVRSLKARYSNEDLSIRQVFDTARETAPCILVMEDIDALITAETRSYFLNELDGFRKNVGLLVIATTNHPERLDPAIVDRPSRFDRKYHFELPAIAERLSYLNWWNPRLDPELQLTANGMLNVAAATDGFSFAYLKELMMASAMAWFNDSATPMDAIMAAQVRLLREQMTTGANIAPVPKAPVSEEEMMLRSFADAIKIL